MKKREVRRRREERRAFWFALAIGLFVFITAAGLVVVDYQGRRLSFGDTVPPLSLDRQSAPPRLRVKVFGAEADFDATSLDRAIDFICDFGCIPHK